MTNLSNKHCVYMHAYMCTHTYIHVCTCAAHLCVYVCTPVYLLHMCVHTYVYACTHLCSYLCACMCTLYYVCLYVEARGWLWVSFFITFHHIFGVHCLSSVWGLLFGLDYLASELEGSSCLFLSQQWVHHHAWLLCEHWESRYRSLYLHSKHTTYQAVSLVPMSTALLKIFM